MRLVSQEKDLASRQPEKRPGTSSLSGSCCGRILGQLGDGEKNTPRYSHVFCFTEERVFTFLRFSGEPPAVVVCNLIPSSGGGGVVDVLTEAAEKPREPTLQGGVQTISLLLQNISQLWWRLDSPWPACVSKTSCPAEFG